MQSFVSDFLKSARDVFSHPFVGSDSPLPLKRKDLRFSGTGFERLEDRRLMAVYQDAQGWTVFDASADTRTIYVSDSTGNDSNDGLTAATAKQTIDAGKALLRDGLPDWLLLKRGDTFTNQSLGSFDISGRNADEMMLISSYDTGERPQILTGGDSGLTFNYNGSVSFLAIVGLDFTPHTRTTADDPQGMNLTGDGTDIIIENNKIDGYDNNMLIHGRNGEILERVSIRRNVIANAYSTNSHSQGIQGNRTDGLLIEENFFYHNGWHDTIVGAEATIFNHSVYLSPGGINGVLDNVTFRGNISARASSMGLKFQPNKGTHVIENNLFLRNGYSLQIGGGKSQLSLNSDDHDGFSVTANNNVILEGDDNGASDALGVTFANINSGSFANNIIANKRSDSGQFAMKTIDGMGWESEGYGVRNFSIDSNVVYNWRGRVDIVQPTQGNPVPMLQNISFTNNTLQAVDPADDRALIRTYTTDPQVVAYSGNTYHHSAAPASEWFSVGGNDQSYSQWVSATGEVGAQQQLDEFLDPTRGSESYAATLGLTSYDEYIDALMQRSKDNWDHAYSADAINDYIREGFGFTTEEIDEDLVDLPSPRIGGPPSVSVVANDGTASEPSNSGQFTVSLSSASSTNTQISYVVAGTATAGSDYTALSGSVTILAGQTSATIDVSVLDDTLVESSESVSVTLGSITSGDSYISIDNSADTAAVTIADDDTTSANVSVVANDATAAEPNNGGQFTVTLSSSSSTNTQISYVVAGTATAGSDYTALSGSVTILAGQTSATIDVSVLDDALAESSETVSLTLSSITSGAANISIDTNADSAAVTIADDETVAANANSPIGVNLAEVAYHSSQWVFKDVMLQSDEWRPQPSGSMLALDADGNITSLLSGQQAVTYVYSGLDGHYPGGDYTLFYEGEGEIRINGSTLSSGGTVNVVPGSNGITIDLRSTDPNGTGNYFRNIRLIAPGTENGVAFTENYETQPFHPTFLASMEKFKTLRFMDWLRTNNSQNIDPSHITPMTAATQGRDRGVAPEYLALLANTLQADAWINIPHQATDAYVIEFATRLKATMNPNLKLYVEYSNEVWNYGFDQAGYSRDRGYELGLDSSSGNQGEAEALLRYYSQRSVEIFHLFDQVFVGASNNQLVKVLGTQFASAWRSDTIMDWQDAHLEADVLAVAPYINTLRNADGSRYTADQLLAMGEEGILDDMELYIEQVSRPSLSDQIATATSHNLRLVAYEGGPGLVGLGVLRNNQQITDLLTNTNRNPRMAEVYTQLLDVWKELGSTDFVAFNNVRKHNNNGSWGILEYQDQDLATAPKYTALMDFIDANDRWWETSAQSLNSLMTVDAAYAEALRPAADQLFELVYESEELASPVAQSGDLSSDLQTDTDSQNGDQQVTVDELSDDRNEDFLYLEDSYEDRYALAGFIADPTDAELVGVLDSALEEYNPLVSLF